MCTHVRGHVVQELALPSLSDRGNKWPAQGPFLNKTGKLLGFKKDIKAFLRSKKKKSPTEQRKKTVPLTYAKHDHTIYVRSPQTPAARWATAWDMMEQTEVSLTHGGQVINLRLAAERRFYYIFLCVCVKLYMWSLRTH